MTAEMRNELCDRAWIELDYEALRHNVEFFKGRLPKEIGRAHV